MCLIGNWPSEPKYSSRVKIDMNKGGIEKVIGEYLRSHLETLQYPDLCGVEKVDSNLSKTYDKYESGEYEFEGSAIVWIKEPDGCINIDTKFSNGKAEIGMNDEGEPIVLSIDEVINLIRKRP